MENCKKTTHGCIGAQYEALINETIHRQLRYIRQVTCKEEKSWRSKLPNGSPHSAWLDGNSWEEPQQEEEGRSCVGDLQLVERLGSGTFGTVYRAKKKKTCGHNSRKEYFAVKVVPARWTSEIEKIVLTLSVGHPFLVQLFSCFEAKGSVYYVMEYMEGGTLLSMLHKKKRLPEEVARFYAAEIILAVDFLHGYGIVHRDIKPGNILLDRDGHCKLSDFGLSKVAKYAASICGTEPYMAPEILVHCRYGWEVDWWSLGLVIYEMMLGLYKGREFVHPKRYPSYMTKDAVSILRRFLTSNPCRRLGTRGDIRPILRHPFFKTVDWEAVLQKRVQPPQTKKVTRLEEKDGNGGHRSTVKDVEDVPLEGDVPIGDEAVDELPIEEVPEEDAPIEEDVPIEEEVPAEDVPVEEVPVEDVDVEEVLVDVPVEDDGLTSEDVKEEDTSSKEEVEQLGGLLQRKEEEMEQLDEDPLRSVGAPVEESQLLERSCEIEEENQPELSIWWKIIYVAGGVFVGLVSLALVLGEVETIDDP